MRKIFPVVAAGATTLALAGGTYGYATVNKTVSLTVDGETRQVATMAGTVAELLQSQDIAVGAHDQVAPAPAAVLADGGQVAVDHGRQVTFTVDGAQHVLWTTADTVADAVAASGLDLEGAKLSPGAGTAVEGDGLTVTAATRKSVTLDAAGTTKKLTTHAQTVADVLREAKVSVDRDDELSPGPSTAVSDGDRIVFTDVEVRTERKTSRIAYQTVRKNSAKLAKGTTKVDTEGESGRRTLTYRVVTENGKTTSRKQVGSKVTDAPTTEVVLVGTKVAKKPATSAAAPSGRSSSSGTSSSSSSGSSTTKAPSVASGGVWDKLAQCEAGGNWSINTGNGFYGGLQFTLQTWRGYGGTGMPHQASREQQIAVAKKVQAGQGWGAWPACSAKLGLR